MTRIRGVLTTRGRTFVACGLTLLVGGLLLGFTDITRVGVLLSALPVLAGVSALGQSNRVAVTRTVHPTRLVVDQSASVAVVLANSSGRRTRVKLAEEQIGYLLGSRPRFVLPAMAPGEIREVTYQIRCQVRGRFRLGPLTLRRQDPYGLATTTVSLPGSTDILVLPHVELLAQGRPRASGIGTEGPIPHMVALHGEDDVAVRSYRNGDDLRRIHWPSTAHRAELMVRQEDHPAMHRAVIVLDSRAVAHQSPTSPPSPTSGTMSSFEWAVTAAASIASHLSERHYTIHLASSETAAESPSTTTVELDDALAWLAVAQVGAAQQFDQVLRWAHPLTSSGGMVIAIVTDHDEDLLRRTAALRRQEGTGLLLLLDTASFARPGPAAASDRTLALAQIVSAAGWNTCVVTAGMTVSQAWDLATARSGLMAGFAR